MTAQHDIAVRVFTVDDLAQPDGLTLLNVAALECGNSSALALIADGTAIRVAALKEWQQQPTTPQRRSTRVW